MSLWQLEWQTLPVIRPPKGGGSSAWHRVYLYGTSDINEHIFPFDIQESALAKAVCWLLLHNCPFLFSTLSPPSVDSPCFLIWEVFLPPTGPSSICFHLLLFSPPLGNCLNKSLQSNDCGRKTTVTERQRCDHSRCLFWLRNKKINTIKSRPRLNELAAEGKTTEEERVSFFSRAWNNPTHLNTSFICALCFNKEDG